VRRSVLIALVLAAAVCGVASGQSGQPSGPPPAGGFDTTICAGRSTHAVRNGRIIGQLRNKPSLYTVRPDGSGTRRITHPPRPYGDFYPAPSPDGRTIAFLRLYTPSVGSKPTRLMVVDVRTHATRLVRTDLFEEYQPAWSPDGRWLTAGVDVHATSPLQQTRQTMLIHPDGTGLHALDAGGYLLLDAGWSPNGRCLAGFAHYHREPGDAYAGDAGLAVLPAEGGRPDTFFPHVPCPRSGWAGCASGPPSFGPDAAGYVDWTSDGRGLLMLRGLWRRPTADPARTDAVRVGLSASAAGRVLARDALIPHLSPDNRFLVGYSRARKAFVVYRGRRVVHRFGRHFHAMAWAPAAR
jgi:dipeptidyl aminopeptidase/acylaminoacyl peptidase